jgi:hypothetical protein
MILTIKEYREYLKAHLQLLYYCHLKQTGKSLSFLDFKNKPLKVKFDTRNYFYKHLSLLESFLIQSNDITEIQKNILNGFKSKISGDFVILKQLKTGAIFIDAKTEKVYSVIALSESFDQFFDSFPVFIKTTILPFKEKIIYDGFLNLNAYIGPGIARNMNSIYLNAKENKRVIKTLS